MSIKIKNVLWFGTRLVQSGGGERVTLEVARTLAETGHKVNVVVYQYDSKKTFEGSYDFLKIIRFDNGSEPRKIVNPIQRRVLLWKKRLWLRRIINQIKPDIVITTGTWSQVVELHLATLGMSLNYGVHVFGSLFAFGPDAERTKYATVFRKVFAKIRDTLPSYQATVPALAPKMGFRTTVANEIAARLKKMAIQRAKIVWVLSERNAWETEQLYGVKPVVLRGAFPKAIFKYKSDKNVFEEIGLCDSKVILSVCRLVANKRVDLCIKAFAEFSKINDDAVLVIGGTGPEEAALRQLVDRAGLGNRVRFVGYIPEKRLLDYYSNCDVAIHLDLADFDIAPLEALAVGAVVIWSNEMSIPEMKGCEPIVFEVSSDPFEISLTIDKALKVRTSECLVQRRKDILHGFTWEKYCEKMIEAFNE